jgi:hypothetical protein
MYFAARQGLMKRHFGNWHLERFFTGAIAGLIATEPMTTLMLAGKRSLPWRSREPLPPLQITRNALRSFDGHHQGAGRCSPRRHNVVPIDANLIAAEA